MHRQVGCRNIKTANNNTTRIIQRFNLEREEREDNSVTAHYPTQGH